MINAEEILLSCNCNCAEHVLMVKYFHDDDFPEVYVDVYLSDQPFWKRIKYAIKYIFGWKSKFGAFDEVLLGEKHIKPLEQVVKHLKQIEGKLLQKRLFDDGHTNDI